MVVWPFPVDWKDGYQVTLSFKTEVIVSRTRREQRRALRMTPRRTVEFTSRMWEADFLKFKRLLAASQDQQILMADAVRKVALAAVAAEGSSAVQVVSVPEWLVAGRRFLLRIDKQFIDCQVQSITGTTVALAAPLPLSAAAGTIVYAGMLGQLPSSLRYDQTSSRIGAVKVSFAVTPGSEPLLPETSLPTFNGREIWSRKPNWRDGVSVESRRDSEMVDYGFGVTETFSQQGFTSILRDGTWLAATVESASEIQGFFERMRGRQGEFYAPRWEQDLVLSGPLSAGESVMRVSGSDVAETYADDTVHKSLLVALRDGTNIYRRVSDIAADGTESVLTLTASWPADVAVEDVLMVTWAPVCRFATDDIVFDWVNSEVAEVKMTHMALEALSPES